VMTALHQPLTKCEHREGVSRGPERAEKDPEWSLQAASSAKVRICVT
jgi:hypothetical protein